jgi:FHS family L-fucose permease-like MFS transporter
MGGGGPAMPAPAIAGGYLTGKALIFPLSLVISLFFLWGFSYGTKASQAHMDDEP